MNDELDLPPVLEEIPPWYAVMYDGYSIDLAKRAETLFQIAIQPACERVASELEQTPCGPDSASFHKWDAVKDTQLELHRSFASALGGLWERNFRRHLAHSAYIIADKSDANLKQIETGGWNDLIQIFQTVRGFPLSRFPTYEHLALLYDVTSAVRHGNGSATERLFQTRPDLFSHEPINNHFAYFTLGGEPPHSIHRLEITFPQLAMFKDGIVDFWKMIRALQLSSPRLRG